MAEFEHHDNRKEIFSKAVKAGKRTYFFDVKATRSDDYYLTITESKKRFDQNGEKAFYEKHKIFLYKEDFEKFIDGLNEAVAHIKTNRPEMPTYERHEHKDREEQHTGSSDETSKFTDFDFDDLGKKDE
jgi:hypothetical protein